ncbi:type II secretion system F family protein [Bacillus kwashiorkori]|uniref:type II secretion system F family protein n=1 Tax=Bacillus kwashiorkori TaxID=1522318 RepID=UPI000B28748F|nr:type II secretion system F family protein [Bacillus kwashiorkori]
MDKWFDIFLYIALVLLIATYIFVVIRRKKREKQAEINDQKQFMDRKKMMEIIRSRYQGEQRLIDYSEYTMNFKEYIVNLSIAIAILFFIGYLFYENIILAAILSLLGFIYPRIKVKELIKKRKEELTFQFKEAISSLSASLAAGRSTENSFREVAHDLRLLYPDPNTYIIQEFDLINRRIENGDTIERALEDFAHRSDIEDIINFANVFITCKRTGGDLVEVIRRTADIISDKIEIQQDITVMVAQKKFEARLLSVTPIGMILLMKYIATDYMEPLFQFKTGGTLMMTISFTLIVIAFWLSQKIMDIKV